MSLELTDPHLATQGLPTSQHVVKFYDRDEALIEAIAEHVAAGLDDGGSAVIVATEPHRNALHDLLASRGIAVESLLASARLMMLDARGTLESLTSDHAIAPERFAAWGAPVLEACRAAAPDPRVPVRVYGEMVNLLWEEGRVPEALALEELWNELGRCQSFYLMCGYRLDIVGRSGDVAAFDRMCRSHTHVIPAQAAPRAREDLMRELGRLQQRSRALEIELRRRNGLVSALEDARTRRRLAEQRLRVADGRKDEFLAMLAHELRNPLAPIVTVAQLIRMRMADHDGAELVRHLDLLDRQTHHLCRLVDDLLEVSRITRGKIRLECEPIEAAATVARAVEMSRPLIDSRGHRLTVTLPHEPLWLHGDTTRLAQVLGNLLNNAAKYTDEGGRIGLSADREGGDVVFRIRDTGIGIPPELRPHLFELFTQGDTSLDRSQGGLGIGLTLVRGLVELHDGTVEARSEGPGRGSEFVVRLPALEVVDGPPPRRAERWEGPVVRRRVLVVDDNLDAATSMHDLLGAMGHTVDMAHDGASTLEQARSWRPEVVLLDIGLPRMDGYEVARQLRREHGDGLCLVALTGYGQLEDRRRSRAAGFDHHLVKPADLDALRAILARVGPAAPPSR